MPDETTPITQSQSNQSCAPVQSNRPKPNRPKRKPKSASSEKPEQPQAEGSEPKRNRRPRKRPNNKQNAEAQAGSSTDQANHGQTKQPNGDEKPKGEKQPNGEKQPDGEKPKMKRRPQRSGNNNNNQQNDSRRNPKFTKNRAQGQLTADADEQADTSQSKIDKGKRPSRRREGKKQQQIDPKDLASSLAQDLKTASYECMVCWDVVRQGHQTWACDCCWAVFHLSCIKQWATKSLAEKETNKPVTNWRCPGCQHTRTAIPKDYICFCGKQRNPDQSRYMTPHSCGQLCHKSRNCPHECLLLCHPGPCPPCKALGPITHCFCGQHSRQVQCIDTDYSVLGYECEDVCGERLGCEKHNCEEKCHLGLCPPCTVQEEHKCYCGKHSREATCGSERGTPCGDHTGYFECDEICNRTFACGQHQCQKKCHPQDIRPAICPYDPRVVRTCPCGSNSITLLLDGASRTNCTDPIPTCSSECGKQLPCGHTCAQTCHLGECPPCEELVEVPCRCRSSSFQATCASVCEAAGGEPPLCDKICRSMRNCGRHQCKTECCPASKQKGSKKSARHAGTAHDCPEVCNRTLSCGIHQCKEPCHKGRCQPCLEATFDEVTCHCGRTQLEPPVRCGTKLPPCPHPCVREAPCGHVRLVQHPCHPDSESCPPCVMLVSRKCVCGKTEMKNVPCYRESPRCGRVCEKPLKCGRHRCTKTCHSGSCLADDEACVQPCNGKRSNCGHPCSSRCHGISSCPESEECKTLVRVSCKCGQNALMVPCNATKDNAGSKRELSCNDFCAKVERNRRLASALEIDRDTVEEPVPTTDELGYYDDSLCEFYLENLRWCKQMETSLIEFCKDTTKHVMHCKPMKSGFRKFIHRYSVHFNVATEAVDPEPYRNVIVRKSLGPVRIPSPLLSVAAHHPSMNRPPPPSAVVKPTSSKQPVNALCLSDLAFGLIKSELDMELASAFGADTPFTSEWLTDSDAVLVIPTIDKPIEEKEEIVWQLKKKAKESLQGSGNAARVDCCWVDQHGKITWTERRQIVRQQETEEEQQTPAAHSSNAFEALSSSSSDEGWMRVGQPSQDAWEQEPMVKEKAASGAAGSDDWEDLAK
ncbi:hypothetical protein BJV82DRAFT_670718 [Fennellomyces sp. T-0311]|nr:hypothetical protein BJV82DRAFT_670718 [Fennellomyces sp. T-0311]